MFFAFSSLSLPTFVITKFFIFNPIVKNEMVEAERPSSNLKGIRTRKTFLGTKIL